MGFAKDAPRASNNVIQQFFGSAGLFDKIGVVKIAVAFPLGATY